MTKRLSDLLNSIDRLVGRLAKGSGRGDETGAVAILSAGIIVFLLAATTVTVDGGLALYTKRHLQGATDAAALAAALDTSRASAIADLSMVSNGYSAGDITSVQTGSYVADEAVAVDARFTPGGAPANAVRVASQTTSPLYFYRAISGVEETTIVADATAATVNMAGFRAGSGLAQLDEGLVNDVLTQTLGTNISLTVMNYEGLLDTDIDALTFLDTLATNLSLTGGTYQQLLDTNVTVGEVVDAAAGVLSAYDSLTTAELNALNGLTTLSTQLNGGPQMKVGELMAVDVWADRTVGSTNDRTAIDSDLNLYQIVSSSAQVANGSNLIDLDNNVVIPGTADISVYMTMTEPMQPPQPPIRIGPEGSSVHTAQTRLYLDVEALQPLGLLGDPTIKVPVYVEVASGDAYIDSIGCAATPADDATVTVAAKSGAGDVYLGQVSPGHMSNYTQPVSVGAAQIMHVPLVARAYATSQVSVGSGSYENLVFTQTDIQNAAIKTTTSQGMTNNLVSTLMDSVSINIQVLGILTVSLGDLESSLLTVLGSVLGVLDPTVDTLLSTLGVKLGYLDVLASGVRCGVPVLVG